MPWLTTSILLTFGGFYLWYATSDRARVQPTFLLEDWASRHGDIAKISGSSLLLLAAVVMLGTYGLGAGFFFYLVLLMTIASLVIMLQPLGLVTRAGVLVGTLLALIIEVYYLCQLT